MSSRVSVLSKNCEQQDAQERKRYAERSPENATTPTSSGKPYGRGGEDGSEDEDGNRCDQCGGHGGSYSSTVVEHKSTYAHPRSVPRTEDWPSACSSGQLVGAERQTD